MATEYIGQNEKFGVEIAQNEPYKSTPHIVLLPRAITSEWTADEKALEQREFPTMASARKAAKKYLGQS